MYVRGYLQGSENGRVVTIEILSSVYPWANWEGFSYGYTKESQFWMNDERSGA